MTKSLVIYNAKAGKRSIKVSRSDPTNRGPLQVNQAPIWTPQIAQMSFRLRYVAAATGIYSILNRNILDLIYVGTSSSAGYCLYDQFRIRAVELRYCGTTATPVFASVQFNGTTGGTQGDYKQHSGTSIGLNPLVVVAKPSKSSTASTWQGYSSSVLMSLDVPSACLIDVILDLRMDDQQAAQSVNYAVVGATVGQVYFRGLDGVASANSNLPPFGPVLGG